MRLPWRSGPEPYEAARYEFDEEFIGGDESCTHDLYRFIKDVWRRDWSSTHVRECLRCGQRVVASSRTVTK